MMPVSDKIKYNIYILSRSPTHKLHYLTDSHVRYLPSQYIQLLSAAYEHLTRIKIEKLPDGAKSSPAAHWLMYSMDNYFWMIEHVTAICLEYHRRFGKEHKSLYKINKLADIDRDKFHCVNITPPRLILHQFMRRFVDVDVPQIFARHGVRDMAYEHVSEPEIVDAVWGLIVHYYAIAYEEKKVPSGTWTNTNPPDHFMIKPHQILTRKLT